MGLRHRPGRKRSARFLEFIVGLALFLSLLLFLMSPDAAQRVARFIKKCLFGGKKA
jgi:hypothetical protein